MSTLLGETGKYQLLEVNSGFDDDTTEILLLIRTGRRSFAYSLGFPHGQGVQAILGYPMAPKVVLFRHGAEVGVLANFFGPAKGIYRLTLPLESGRELSLLPAGGRQFEEITVSFRNACSDDSTKQAMCDSLRYNDFESFFEKHCGPCGVPARTNDQIDARYAEFWLKRD